jgi:hypothetical protein
MATAIGDHFATDTESARLIRAPKLDQYRNQLEDAERCFWRFTSPEQQAAEITRRKVCLDNFLRYIAKRVR